MTFFIVFLSIYSNTDLPLPLTEVATNITDIKNPTIVTDIDYAFATVAKPDCSHQCNTCGIMYDCAETRQNCKLPFSSFKTKCVLCVNRY
jgi:hypothetical protein